MELLEIKKYILFFIWGAFAIAKAPSCSYEKERVFLTKEQKVALEREGDNQLTSSLIFRYHKICQGKKTQTIYLLTDILRTMNQTLAISVTDNGNISSIETKDFSEPIEYKAPKKWLAQYKNKKLSNDLMIGKEIDGMTGATLTTTSVNLLARRALILEKVLGSKE